MLVRGFRCARGGRGGRARPALTWSLVLCVLCDVCGTSVMAAMQVTRLEDWDKRGRVEGSADASCGSWGTRTPHHSSIALPRPAGWGVCKHVHVCQAGPRPVWSSWLEPRLGLRVALAPRPADALSGARVRNGLLQVGFHLLPSGEGRAQHPLGLTPGDGGQRLPLQGRTPQSCADEVSRATRVGTVSALRACVDVLTECCARACPC